MSLSANTFRAAAAGAALLAAVTASDVAKAAGCTFTEGEQIDCPTTITSSGGAGGDATSTSTATGGTGYGGAGGTGYGGAGGQGYGGSANSGDHTSNTNVGGQQINIEDEKDPVYIGVPNQASIQRPQFCGDAYAFQFGVNAFFAGISGGMQKMNPPKLRSGKAMEILQRIYTNPNPSSGNQWYTSTEWDEIDRSEDKDTLSCVVIGLVKAKSETEGQASVAAVNGQYSLALQVLQTEGAIREREQEHNCGHISDKGRMATPRRGEHKLCHENARAAVQNTDTILKSMGVLKPGHSLVLPSPYNH